MTMRPSSPETDTAVSRQSASLRLCVLCIKTHKKEILVVKAANKTQTREPYESCRASCGVFVCK